MAKTREERLQKKREHYHKNKVKYAENNKRWMETHKQYRKKYQKEYEKKYRKHKKEHLKKYKREYYQAHKKEHKEKTLKWLKNNPGKSAEYRRTYRHKNKIKVSVWRKKSRNRKMVHDFSASEWEEKLIITKGICPSCQKNVGISKLTLDHIFPVSKAKPGRIYTINDVQPLCRGCNAKKNNKIVEVKRYEKKPNLQGTKIGRC